MTDKTTGKLASPYGEMQIHIDGGEPIRVKNGHPVDFPSSNLCDSGKGRLRGIRINHSIPEHWVTYD